MNFLKKALGRGRAGKGRTGRSRLSRNDEIASLLEEFADLLEAKDVAYKPSSYRRAAENIRESPTQSRGWPPRARTASVK